MLYLISGSSRSGKTIIAKKFSNAKGIPYLSLDWLIMGFTNGIPEYGIHDLLMPDEIAERFWDFFKAMCQSMIWSGDSCIIEGEAMLPELIVQLKKKFPEDLKVCFLGYTDVSIEKKFNEIKTFSTGKNDWLIDKTDAYIKDHINNMIGHSKRIKESCLKNDLTYFDTSDNFNEALSLTLNYLSS